eukprot:TRINITY_DN4910_c0_g1_i3.p1 TRINITY_DN4910_c0_g1~~TRINITY_DN4910_c0_g1_i3.p1  ORF type:complete len:439 (-),score=113.66 TRINITY_DN4910_c0_g1_i3:82-1398(-)
MASVVPAEADDSLTCSVCHELFTEPKLLPCGHLICRNCLISLLNSNKDASCPLCRSCIVEAGDGGSGSLEDVVDGLPTDLSMCKLVEAERLLNRQQQCCACDIVLATCLCLDCGDLMCKSCAKLHVKFSLNKKHVVKDLSGLTAEKLAADDQRPSPCAHHPGEVCNLYCPSHQEFMCHVCWATRHRSCQEVKDLEEKMKEAGALLTELVDRLKEGQRAVGLSLQQLDQHLQDSQKKTQALIQEIDALCHRLQMAVDQCGRRLKDLVQKAAAEVQEATAEGKTHLLQRKGKLTCHQNVAHRIQGMKATDHAANMATLMKTRLDDMDLSGTLPQGFKVISTLTLEMSTEAVSTVEKMMTQLGEVRLTPAEMSAQPQVSCWQLVFLPPVFHGTLETAHSTLCMLVHTHTHIFLPPVFHGTLETTHSTLCMRVHMSYLLLCT